MSKLQKKVILLLVEGDSEETLLIDRLRELFSDKEIKFEIENGDIFYDFSRPRVHIKSTIGDKIKSVMKKRKFSSSDILAVIHILDTDGCLVANDRIKINSSQDNYTMYTEEHIEVKNEDQRQRIIHRNAIRSKNINTMNCTETILSKSLDYQLFYFSRHLEHVLFNEMNPNRESKIKDIEDFIDDLKQPIERFLSEFVSYSNDQEYKLKYSSSWQHLKNETNSLNRFTNVPLLFDYLSEKVDTLK